MDIYEAATRLSAVHHSAEIVIQMWHEGDEDDLKEALRNLELDLYPLKRVTEDA